LLVLLPPSETKRPGGTGGPLDVTALKYPSLNSQRRVLVRALRALAQDPDATMTALKLGRTQSAEVGHNRALTTSPTMAVLDRYTGVLYDALDSPTLPAQAREFAGRHVVVHSALFGPVGALDLIPAYRMSHDSRLPGLTPKKHWADSITAALGDTEGLVLDVRSEAYVALGAAPAGPGSVFLRIVTETIDGHTRALNHFNKKSKGEFTRALVRHGQDFGSVAELLDWAADAGFRLRPGAPGELELVVDQLVGASARA
jgi:cytoplasmic iron level regulating protein YaaA (DUF328/UPF0246 family)